MKIVYKNAFKLLVFLNLDKFDVTPLFDHKMGSMPAQFPTH